MKKLVFLTRSEGGTDNEKIRSFAYEDQIPVCDVKLDRITEVSGLCLDQYIHHPIIDNVEYRILFMIEDTNEMIDGYIEQLKLRDECYLCYYHNKSICFVNKPEIDVGDVHINSMFIKNEQLTKNEQPRRELCEYFRENVKREPSQALIDAVRIWLGDEGRDFFTKMKEKYGILNACWSEQHIPHSVHFREGMQVRNFMRSTRLCLDWDDIDYDDNWVEIVEKALNL